MTVLNCVTIISYYYKNFPITKSPTKRIYENRFDTSVVTCHNNLVEEKQLFAVGDVAKVRYILKP